MNSRKCDICNVDVHRASYTKHLRRKMHLENLMNIPEWLFQEPIENKIKNKYIPESLKQIARDTIKLDDKQLNKELAKKMINLFTFTESKLKLGFKINSDTHHINHINSKFTFTSNYLEFGIEVRYFNKIKKEISVIYATLIYQ